ncbi:MAG: immune inhibitor A [Chloroflexi bacterium]|nr:immune inhibitor A [Chloroflexota bacterium]MBU1749115.1 immune inhibitor A [Chloroflexota bacterium]
MSATKSWRIVSLVMVLAMVLALLPGVIVAQAPTPAQPARVAIGAHRLSGTHLRPPSRDVLAAELQKEGLPIDATPEQIRAAEKTWFEKYQKQTDTWVSPKFQEYVLQREKELASGDSAQAIVPVSASVYYMAVDFGATETFTIPMVQPDGSCVTETHTVVGPLQGLIPDPGPLDNQSLWYSPSLTANPKFYEKLMFGYEGAGRVRLSMTDPDDGLPGINLAGYTMQDYFDNVAGDGNVYITGTVEGWVTVPHSEGRYGADNCATGSPYGGAGVPVATIVEDALQVFSQTHPAYWTDPTYWPTYDGNHDGIVDSFGVIHAGVGDESGGGAEGSFAIWSHSSDLRNYARWPNGIKVYEGDPGTTADDIIVGPYTVQPESLDVGVLTEEFGHNFFGLPDLYTGDASNSVGDWDTMSGGSWMGWLGGTVPASMPLWFKMIAAFDVGGVITPVNWHEPTVTRDYDDPAGNVTIGQLEKTPGGVNKGVKVDLPPYSEVTPNMAGTGNAAYSGTGRDQTDIFLTKDIAIPAGVTGTLTLDAYWDIENDWDYGYVEINGVSIADMDGITTNYDPNGNNLGNGITAQGAGTLRFDLSAYADSTITLGLRYKTDAGTTLPGLWIDNVMLDGVLIDDFEGATGPGTFDKWTNTDPGWYVVPIDNTYNRYYLVEWRTMTDYDQMIAKTAYIHNTVDPDWVTRIPYNMPAALLYYRDTKYSATYAMGPNHNNPPSRGSKYQLLVVDQNWWPMRIGDTLATYDGYWTGRINSYDAGLTLQPTQAFTIPAYYGLPGEGPWVYPSKPAVTSFNDTQGYYGGYWMLGNSLYWMDRYGSAVIPARDLYGLRLQDFYGNPIYGYYGYPWSPSWLGSGNPGGDSYGTSAQFGVNIDLLSKAGDDAYNSTATLHFRNYSVDFNTTITQKMVPGALQVTYQTVVDNLGNQDAHDVNLYYWLDPDLSLVSINTESTAGAKAQVEKGVRPERVQPRAKDDEPSDEVLMTLPLVAAGEKVTITVVTQMPAAPGSIAFYSELWPFDGQVERGPWWLDSYADISFNYLPLVIKN